MMTISLTTIIAGAVVVLLAILGSLINPFLRSLRFPDNAGNEENPAQKLPRMRRIPWNPRTYLGDYTAHDNLYELGA